MVSETYTIQITKLNNHIFNSYLYPNCILFQIYKYLNALYPPDLVTKVLLFTLWIFFVVPFLHIFFQNYVISSRCRKLRQAIVISIEICSLIMSYH